LTLAKLRFPPKWLHVPKKPASEENILYYKTKLLSEKSIQWLHKQRIQQKLQEHPESSDIILECRNIKSILSQAAEESLGK